jgi:glycosyltransferase involved in cell wall biosynthesis
MEGPIKPCLGIGILAHNEAARLPVLLDSLFAQSIFSNHDPRWATLHVACIPNGCSDATAAVARRCLAEAVARPGLSHVSWTVDELATAGKANAWNHCVHTSLSACDYICFLDADIVFAAPDTILAAMTTIIDDPRVCVVTDRPVKRNDRVGWLGALSRYFSRTVPAGPPPCAASGYRPGCPSRTASCAP